MSEEKALDEIIHAPTSLKVVGPRKSDDKPEAKKGGLVEQPFLSILDVDSVEHPMIEDDDSRDGTFTFCGALPEGRITFVMHTDREYRIPNRYHHYYGYVLENDATEIFTVRNPAEEILEPDGTIHYLLNEESELVFNGGDRYRYEISLLLDHRDQPSRVRSITLSARVKGYIHYADTLFDAWAESGTVQDTDNQLEPGSRAYMKESFFQELRD